MKKIQNSVQDFFSQSTTNIPRTNNFIENIENSIQQENNAFNLLENSSLIVEEDLNENTNEFTLTIDNNNNNDYNAIYEHHEIDSQFSTIISENFSVSSNLNFNNEQGTNESEQITLSNIQNFSSLYNEDNYDEVSFDHSITDFNYLKLFFRDDEEHLTLC